MSKLDRTIADAWRAARWTQSHGQPACPTCFDGEDLQPRPPDPRNPDLGRYFCTTCKRELSDWSGTWIAPLKAPLARWAWLVWQADATPAPTNIELERISGLRDETIKAMRAKLATAPPGFLSAWLSAMIARGLTRKQLAAAVTKGKA